MLKNLTVLATLVSLIAGTAGFIPQQAIAEPPPRPANSLPASSPQERKLLDALSKTPGYTPSVGQYVIEFKKAHSQAKTEAQHKAAQQKLNQKYPTEAKFFQMFMSKVVALQQRNNVALVLQAIKRDGKMDAKFQNFLNEMASIKANTMQELLSKQQQVIKRYPAQAKLVMEYSKKLKK